MVQSLAFSLGRAINNVLENGEFIKTSIYSYARLLGSPQNHVSLDYMITLISNCVNFGFILLKLLIMEFN